MAKSLSSLTKEASSTKSELSSLKALLETTTNDLTTTRELLAQRERLLEYVATLLLNTQRELDKYPSLQNPPSKITFFWVITHLGQITSFIRFVITTLQEFARNIKFASNAPTE